MRKLLQNKIVVSCLALVAVLCVAADHLKLPARLSLAIAAREPSTDPASAPADIHVPGVTQFSRKLRNWQEMFAIDPALRDPFAPVVQPVPAKLTASVMPDSPNPPPSFVLQAVSIEGSRAFAVINHSVVAEGELISGYRVERILPTHVELKGNLGPLVVRMDRTDQRPKPPIANAPSVDLLPTPAQILPGAARR